MTTCAGDIPQQKLPDLSHRACLPALCPAFSDRWADQCCPAATIPYHHTSFMHVSALLARLTGPAGTAGLPQGPTRTPATTCSGVWPTISFRCMFCKTGRSFSLTSIHWSIIWFSTFACSPVSCRTPMASCMVMMATTQATAKIGRVNAPRACRGNDHCADGRAVCAGHTAVAPHPLQLEFAQQDKVDQGLEHLRHEPARSDTVRMRLTERIL